MKFLDQAKIHVSAGDGGAGAVGALVGELAEALRGK
jgi:GTPase involved in cell partitioning and DNA repair